MRVLLTGAGGQLGQALVQSVPDCVELFAYTRLQLDVTELSALQAVCNEQKFDIIINAAAYNNVDLAEIEPHKAYAVNCDGVGYLAQIAKQFDIGMIHISTDYVFDGKSTRPYTEEDVPNPINAYGASKLAGERALLEMHSHAWVVRTSSIFSEGDNNFVSRILKAGMQHTVLKVRDDLVGCPTPAKDLAQMLWQLVQLYGCEKKQPWGVLHYAGAPACSRYEWACEIVAKAKAQGLIDSDVKVMQEQVRFENKPKIAARPAYTVLNCKRIGALLRIKQANWRDF